MIKNNLFAYVVWYSSIVILSIVMFLFLFSYFSKEICFEEEICFDVDIADTVEKRTQGLMWVENLSEDKWMLFIFPNENTHSFWMKNTFIPLDIVWLNSNKEIVDIKHNAKPCKKEICPSYSPKEDALYVLELNGWIIEKKEIKIWDSLKFKNIE